MRIHTRTLGFLGLIVGASLLLVACDGTDAAPKPTAATTSDPTVIATVEDSRDGDGGGAGGGIEPANPAEPPTGAIGDGASQVALGLGSYCWSPPQGSGSPAICADAIGIITATKDLVTSAGATLTITGDLAMPPMGIVSAALWIASDEPITYGPDFRAWQPLTAQIDVTTGDHTMTLPDDLEPGRYILAVNYSAGPDRGSDAMYGALLVVE